MADDWDEYYDYSDYIEPELEELPRDKVIDDAKGALIGFFSENQRRVFSHKQIEVKFERPYYHWITARAIRELVDEGFLGEHVEPLIEKTRVNFIYTPRKWRYYKRPVKTAIQVIREYSHHAITGACGEQADTLFLNAFMLRGFMARDQDTNQYGERKWTETGHNLDFIMEKDGVVYGCEVKNKFEYIELQELVTKLGICEFLGLKPVFIMRHAPKSYNNMIIRRGGYALIFDMQIYPFGQDALVEKIRKVLDMPVDCPKAIPTGMIDRFMKWHNKQVGVR